MQKCIFHRIILVSFTDKLSENTMNPIDHLPERIRHLRLTKGLSQENMAESLGISTTAYGDLERGKTEITLVRLSAIAETLHTTIGDLLQYQETTVSETEWLRSENRRLLEENTNLKFRLERLEGRLKDGLQLLTLNSKEKDELPKERTRIGF